MSLHFPWFPSFPSLRILCLPTILLFTLSSYYPVSLSFFTLSCSLHILLLQPSSKEEKDNHQIMQCVFKVLMRFQSPQYCTHQSQWKGTNLQMSSFLLWYISSGAHKYYWIGWYCFIRLRLPCRLSLQALFPLSTCILPWRIFRHKNWVCSQKYLWVSTNHNRATTLGVVGSSLHELRQQV